jgi:hypothetical protein
MTEIVEIIEHEMDPPWKTRELFYAGVGCAISRWSNMETVLVEIFAFLIGTSDEKAGLILYSINFHTWLSLISGAIALDSRFSRVSKVWNKKVERLRPLNDVRVRLAHHTVWESTGPEDFGLKPSRFDTRPNSKKYAALTAQDLEEFIADVSKLHMDLHHVYMKVRAIAHASSAKKSDARPSGQHPLDAQ